MNKDEIKVAFSQTQLDGSILGHVWNIVDENDQGYFTRSQFVTAVHILYKVKMGVETPKQIPHEVRTCVTVHFPND